MDSADPVEERIQAAIAKAVSKIEKQSSDQLQAAIAQYEEQSNDKLQTAMAQYEEQSNDKLRNAIAQYEEQAKLETEEKIRTAVAEAIARHEKQAKPIDEERKQSDVADAINEETKSVGPRNLVVCIDGTANQFGVKNSNVVELYHLLIKDPNQVTFYNSGIGTYAKPSWRSWAYYSQVIGHTFDLMIAWNFERIVQEAYRWLSENYRDGDRIFMFGFSRGAYQVRCLSAMIDIIGLIHRGNEAQIPFAYELYAATGKSNNRMKGLEKIDTRDFTPDEGVSEEPGDMAIRFKRSFSREVTVHFVGTWDTVSSVGLVRNKTLPGTTSGMKHVKFFRHALALDERRVKFLPEYAYEGSSLPDDYLEDDNEYGNRLQSEVPPHTKEVWFAGTHSDIGGGNVKNPMMNRSQPPLRWMSYEATAVGLRLNPFEEEWKLIPEIEIHESLTGPWHVLEVLPLKHLMYSKQNTAKRRLHLGSGRYLRPGQKLHSSVIRGVGPDKTPYHPKASLEKAQSDWFRIGKQGTSWSQLLNPDHALPDFVERDLYDRALELAENLSTDSAIVTQFNVDLMREFARMVSSADGVRALREIPNIVSILGILRDVPRDIQCFLCRSRKRLFITNSEQHAQKIPSALAISPDGRHTATVGSLSKTVKIHNIIDGKWHSQASRSLQGHSGAVLCLAFSSDGAHLASGSDDQSVRVWSVKSAESLSHIAHNDAVVSVVFSADASRIASGTSNGTVMISDRVTGASIGTTPLPHTSCITSLAFSSNNSVLSSGSSDGTIHVCSLSGDDIISGPSIAPLKGHTAGIISLAFSPNCHQLVSGSYDCTIRVWDLQSNDTHVRFLYGHTGWITSLAFSPDEEHIVSGSTDSTCRLWESQVGRTINRPTTPFDEWVSSVNISSDGTSIVACSIDGVMTSTSIDISEINHECLYGHVSDVNSVTFSPDSKQLVSCSDNHTIRVWDIQTGTESRHPLEGHTSVVSSVKFSPDGSLMASGSYDRTVRIWDAVTGKQKGEPLQGHAHLVTSVGFSPDGKHLVSGSGDDTVRVWNVETRFEAFKPLEGHTTFVLSVQYSPDGRYIISGSLDGTVRLWDANTGKAVGEPFRGHDTSVNSVAFSPDGTRIVSGSFNRTIRIWDMKTGEAVGEPLRGHTNSVWSVAYSPDGKRIVSGSVDQTVRVWDVETGKEVFEPLKGHTSDVVSVAWSSDGQLIASASYDKTTRLWDANTGDPIRF